MGTWTIKPGHIRLQPWSPDFNPNTQRPTNAQVCIKVHELPWEYWDASILSNMARGIDVLLKLDQATLEGKFGHFACILVDVDLSKELPESLMIEKSGHKFFIIVEYENLPLFCINCSDVGHSLANCKKNPNNRKLDGKLDKKTKRIEKFSSLAAIFVQPYHRDERYFLLAASSD